ncbi:hypothetical protein FG379_003388 [Cryptosporidium bovis]|uniref:uncharacterized protein n=1 Tax=Cryptosporidium bovis TaxID=310047 RepID=UPI00351A7338|nr:hypothetical protein FG379_003388 [Cryptosporidium bovis]
MELLSHVLGSIWVVVSGFLLVIGAALAMRLPNRSLDDYSKKRGIAVLVVGDVGRSPRMQNHALCISKRFCSSVRKEGSYICKGRRECDSDKVNNNHVYIIGYNESICNSSVLRDENITIVDIGKPLMEKYRKQLPLFMFLPVKIIEQSGRTFLRLLSVPNLGGIILQAPPSIPAIPICILVSLLKGVPFVVDWHNYGHTLLIKEKQGTNVKPKGIGFLIKAIYKNILVRSYRFLEFYFGRYSTSSFCVSKAMQKDLALRGIKASVLYDKPSEEFTKIDSITKKHFVLFKYFGSEMRTGYPTQASSKKCRLEANKDTRGGVASSDSPLTDISDVVFGGECETSTLSKLFGGSGNKREINLIKGTPKTTETCNSPPLKISLTTVESSLFLEKTNLKIEDEDLQKVLDILKIETSFINESNESSSNSEDRCLVEIKEETPISELTLKIGRIKGSYKLEIETKMKEDRSCVLITSTSWTPDEDIDLLLEGLILYDKAVAIERAKKNGKQISDTRKEKTLPNLFLIITGKGPMKSEWIKKASMTGMRYVTIRTVFVEADDYPKILASSDLGISLHYSSSGLDLPMKVVDMLGAGIPVISFRYQTMNELLYNNGDLDLFFDNSDELCERLKVLLTGFGDVQKKDSYPTLGLKKIAKQNNSRKHKTFMQEWNDNAATHFENMVI